MKYNPALDGIRALSALVVVMIHAGVPGFRGGYLGVDVFFVLSGYLITRLLVENRPTLGQFYLRRAKRLYPALLGLLAVFVVVAPLMGGTGIWKDALIAGLYLSDYGTQHISNPGWVTHTWSLSVEEHFYLLWPPLLYWALNRFPPRDVARFTLTLAVYLLVWRMAWQWFVGWKEVCYRFDTHATGIVLGCALALYRWEAPKWAGWLGVGLVALAMWEYPIGGGRLEGITVTEVGAALMIAGRWQVPFAVDAFAYVGRLSYGWYLWHLPLLYVVSEIAPQPWPVRFAIGVFGGLALAALSYYTIEAVTRAAPAASPFRLPASPVEYGRR